MVYLEGACRCSGDQNYSDCDEKSPADSQTNELRLHFVLESSRAASRAERASEEERTPDLNENGEDIDKPTYD